MHRCHQLQSGWSTVDLAIQAPEISSRCRQVVLASLLSSAFLVRHVGTGMTRFQWFSQEVLLCSDKDKGNRPVFTISYSRRDEREL